jgi:hypothetical protein
MIQRFAVDTEKQNEYNSKVIDEDALMSILILLGKTVIQVILRRDRRYILLVSG